VTNKKMEAIPKLKHKGQVLIVDDEPYLLEGLFDVLEQEGYRVTTSKNPEEAKILSKKIDFKIALIDLRMPATDGITLAKILRENNINLKVIILTAYPTQETAIKALKSGVADYLIKPVNMEELITAINMALRKREDSMDLESVKSKLYQTQQELDNTRNALIKEGKFSALGQLGMELFHEVKNLLGVMNISAYYLDKNVETQDLKVKKHIGIIKNQIQHSDQIIMSLLDLSRAKQDEDIELDINQSITEILDLLEQELSLNSIKVVRSLDQGINRIKINPNKLKQVSINLILNAKDAMSEGGELRVSTRNEGKNVLIEFSDTGIGISDEDKDKIFNPFFSTKKDKEGMGLGLTVCKSIIEQYKAELIVISNKNEGSNFIIKFPFFEEKTYA